MPAAPQTGRHARQQVGEVRVDVPREGLPERRALGVAGRRRTELVRAALEVADPARREDGRGERLGIGEAEQPLLDARQRVREQRGIGQRGDELLDRLRHPPRPIAGGR